MRNLRLKEVKVYKATKLCFVLVCVLVESELKPGQPGEGGVCVRGSVELETVELPDVGITN